jgi:hypothetical protein
MRFKMNKEERKKQIAEEMKTLVTEKNTISLRIHFLKVELDFIRGHYDKSWEEEYGR